MSTTTESGTDFNAALDARREATRAALNAAKRADALEQMNVPNTRPRKADMLWLLYQDEFWQPEYGPMVRVADMTDTHRWHTSRWLLRRANPLAHLFTWSMVMGPQPSGDAACDAFEHEILAVEREPEAWIRRTRLFEALVADLPSPVKGKKKRHKLERRRFRDLLERAKHWSTCPRNRDLGAEVCTCERDR